MNNLRRFTKKNVFFFSFFSYFFSKGVAALIEYEQLWNILILCVSVLVVVVFMSLL